VSAASGRLRIRDDDGAFRLTTFGQRSRDVIGRSNLGVPQHSPAEYTEAVTGDRESRGEFVANNHDRTGT
jgi:hypothetical protein